MAGTKVTVFFGIRKIQTDRSFWFRTQMAVPKVKQPCQMLLYLTGQGFRSDWLKCHYRENGLFQILSKGEYFVQSQSKQFDHGVSDQVHT